MCIYTGELSFMQTVLDRDQLPQNVVKKNYTVCKGLSMGE